MNQLLPALLLVVLGGFNASAGLITTTTPGGGNPANINYYKAFIGRINLTGLRVMENLENPEVMLKTDNTPIWKRTSKILRLEKIVLKTPASSGDAITGASDFNYSSDQFSVPDNKVGKRLNHARATMEDIRKIISGGDSENAPELSIDIKGHHAGFSSGCVLDPEMNMQTASVPEPSIWKLFALSLLWIPFNRWERKQLPAGRTNRKVDYFQIQQRHQYT